MRRFLTHFSDQAGLICRDEIRFMQENETGCSLICQNLIPHAKGGKAMGPLESK